MEAYKKLGSLTTKFSKLLLTNQFAAAIGGAFFDWCNLAMPGSRDALSGSVERFNNGGCPP
jgi:hypothetical protein